MRLLGGRDVPQAAYHLGLGARLTLFLPVLLQPPQLPVPVVVLAFQLLLFALRSVARAATAGGRAGQGAAALETAPAWPLQGAQSATALEADLQVKLVASSAPRFQVVS